MKSRRNFILNASVGALTVPSIISTPSILKYKNITIGIIGAENSHTAAYGKMFNVDIKFPGAEVKYVWGESDEFAAKAMKAGNIPNQVKDPAEMVGKIDALIVDHRHAKYHIAAAKPFVEAGVPTFIDKPFCYRVSEGIDLLRVAKKKGTPLSSYSTVAHSDGIFELKEKIQTLGKIHNVISTGTGDFDSEYGGIFFYGVHMIEPLIYLFGDDVKSVKVTRHGKLGSINLKFTSGLYATLILKAKVYGWETFVETDKEFIQLKPTISENDPARSYTDMVTMFRTGKEPRSHQSILNGMSILEAIEKSALSEAWVDIVKVDI